jgi:hypothetical protein
MFLIVFIQEPAVDKLNRISGVHSSNALVYNLHPQAAQYIAKMFKILRKYACRQHLELLIGTHCNAYSPMWRSCDSELRGERLEELIMVENPDVACTMSFVFVLNDIKLIFKARWSWDKWQIIALSCSLMTLPSLQLVTNLNLESRDSIKPHRIS